MAKARAQLEGFMKGCPQTLSPYQYLRSVEPSEFLTNSVARLRTLLSTRTDPEAISRYSTLWSLEFRAKPATEHDAVRKQIADDLKRLRTLVSAMKQDYFWVMAEGYKLANDPEGEKWASEQSRVRTPGGSYSTAREEFLKAHPYPKPTDPPEKQKAFAGAYATASADWVRRFPHSVSAWWERVNILTDLEDASPAEVEQAGEGFLRAEAKSPDSMLFMSSNGGTSFSLVVANLYATKGVRVDRLPDLVRQGIPELERVSIGALPSDLYPPGDNSEGREQSRWYGWATIANIWVKAKDSDRARQALAHLQTLAEQSRPKDPKDPKYATKQQTYLRRQEAYWRAMGELAQIEGHKIDAMTFYQNALLARPQPSTATAKDQLGEKALALWKELGGSNEAWQAWSTRKELLGTPAADLASAARWTRLEKAVPEFELADLSGARWRLADFKGKTTLVGIWATW